MDRFWENKSHGKILASGFERTPADSLFWCEDLKYLLMVYVDDFRMAGPVKNLKVAWERLTTGHNALTLDPPKSPDRELGCYHRIFDAVVNGKPVRAMEYDMRDFMRSCVDQYLEVTGSSRSKLKHAETPFMQLSLIHI